MKKILVINCGSSSLKYQLIDMANEGVLAKGLCERIGIEGSKLTHQPAGKDKFVIEKPMPNHKTAIELVMEALKNLDEVSYVRYASVHRQFKDINSFYEEVLKLLKKG